VSAAARRAEGLAGPFALSILLHAAVIAPVVVLKAAPQAELPPMYRVDLVAAPPSETPSAGVVRPESAPEPEAPTRAPAKAETQIREKLAPINAPSRRAPTQATPNITPTPAKVAPSTAPTAGGGPEGGTGTDVANVRTEGVDFPFPGYLQNIVRQVRLNFNPRNPGALRAEVFFFIRRDGSIDGFRFVNRSGNFAFDLEASGAVEAAARAFGPLPAEFPNDVLGVTFTFDPARMR
jgi:protein TonB